MDLALLERIEAWRREGRRIALATVLETWGSAPRRPGAEMLMAFGRDEHDIAVEGSVSGGCVEAAVVELARQALGSGRAVQTDYGVSDADARAVGLACGGRLSVLVEPREHPGAPEEEALIRAALERRATTARFVVAEGPGLGSALAWDGGRAVGSLGSAELDRRAIEAVSGRERAGWLKLDDAPRVFLRPHRPPERLIIVGAVHIAQALARLAPTLDIEVAVVDPRATFATPARFPQVDALVVAWPDAALLRNLGLGLGTGKGTGMGSGEGLGAAEEAGRGMGMAAGPSPDTSLVALAHDPKIDDPALEVALRSGAGYVGALGSRRSHAARVERLRERGLTPDEIARIHAPIGLDIGAETPQEIALGILAEIVQERYREASPPR